MKGSAYYQKELTDIINSHYGDQDPPEMDETLKKNLVLAKIAKLSKNLLMCASEAPINVEQAKLVDLAMRIVMKEHTESFESSKNASFALQNTPTETQKLKGRVKDLEETNEDLQKRLDDLQDRADAMQEELENISIEKEKALQSKVFLTSKTRDEISMKNTELSRLQDQLLITENDLQIMKQKHERFELQIQQLEDDNSALNAENIKLNEKIAKKTNFINEMHKSIEEQQKVIAQLQYKQEAANALTRKSEMEETRKVAVLKILKVNEDLNHEIIDLKKNRDCAILLLQKQAQLINYYNNYSQYHSGQQSSDSGKIKSLKEELEQYKEMVEDMQEDEAELEELRQIVASSTEALQPKYLITPEQLPDTILQILHSSHNEVIEQNQEDVVNRDITPPTELDISIDQTGSSSIVDGLTRFILHILKKGEIKMSFLTGQVLPITGDQTLKLDALHVINEIREQWIEIHGDNESNDVFSSLMQQQTFDIDNQDQLSVSCIMCAISERICKQLQQILEDIRPAKQYLPLICNDKELPKAIVEYLSQINQTLESYIPRISKLLNIKQSSFDTLDVLSQYINESSLLINNLDTIVRPLINFGGRVVEIPSQIEASLNYQTQKTKQEIQQVQQERDQKIKETENASNQLKIKIDELNAIIRSKSFELCSVQTDVSRLKEQLKAARDLVQEANDKVEDLTEENQELTQNYGKVAECVTKLQAEMKRMDVAAKERQDVYDKKISTLLVNERAARMDEVESVRRKMKAENDIHVKEIGKKNERISLLKLQINTMKEEKEQVAAGYKAQISELEQENESITRIAEENDALCKARIDELVTKHEDIMKQNKELAILLKKKSVLHAAYRTEKSIQTEGKIENIKANSSFKDDSNWTAWAQQLVANRIIGKQRKLTNEELMQKISNAVYNSGTQRLIYIIDNLRTQKKLCDIKAPAKSTVFSFKALSLATMVTKSLFKTASTPKKISLLSRKSATTSSDKSLSPK